MTLSGGPIFWILFAMAISSLVVFFERFSEVRRSQIDYQDFIKGVVNILASGGEDEALAICEDAAVPVANVVATAIRHRKGSATALREAVDSQGRAEAGRLERRLASLAIMGQIAPLIIGFIRSVLLVNSQEIVARADLISTSMEAFVAAALGLGVAIPIAVMYGILRVRMDRLIIELEAAATQIVSYLAPEKDPA